MAVKIFVTGGSGFMGSWLVHRLSRSHEVISYDRKAPARRITGVTHVTGDLVDDRSLRSLLSGCRAVVHLASQIGVVQCQTDEDGVQRNILGGSASLMEAIVAVPQIRFVVIASSSEVYGDRPHSMMSEVDEPCPVTSYGRAKVLLENMAGSLTDQGLSVAILRPFNVYGPGQREDFVIPQFCRRILRGAPIRIAGTGDQTRSFTYINDVTSGICAAVRFAERQEGHLTKVNLGSAESVTIRDLARRLLDLVPEDRRPPVQFDQAHALGRDPTQEIMHRRPSTVLARELLGFTATTPLRSGLRRTFAYYAARPGQDEGDRQ